MTRSPVWAACALFLAAALFFPHPLLSASSQQAIANSDSTLLRSLAARNQATLAQLLDSDFTWISSDGKELDQGAVLKNMPVAANSQIAITQRVYGQAAVVHADQGQVHVLRIWVHRPSGWRALLYQEVTQVARSEKPPAGSGDCENPCRSIPFTPSTANEKGAIASWQGVMRAMANDDADAYARLIADEFTATDTHHSRPFTKPERIVQIRKMKLTGAHGTPPPLVSARMFDLGQTVVMIAREQRTGAKPYFNTRMWVHRAGRWQMLFSFNTRIE